MDKLEVLTKIKECGVVAVVRASSKDDALKISQACIEAGIASIEVTFTTPNAEEVIKELVNTYPNGEIIVGAGTVLDPETARIAILAGAKYIVSPSFNLETVKLCNRYQVACMPGAMTIKEVIDVMESGADVVKVFPGELYGPKIIKSIKGPLPQAPVMPTGGVTVDNVAEWINAGAVAVGVGGALTANVKDGDYSSVVTIGKQFVAKVKEARGL